MDRTASPESNIADLVSDDDSSSVSSLDSVNDTPTNNNQTQLLTNTPLTIELNSNPLIEVMPMTPNNQKGQLSITTPNSQNNTPNLYPSTVSVSPRGAILNNMSTPTNLPKENPSIPSVSSTGQPSDDINSSSNKIDTTEFVLMLFFQEFKEQALKIIDEFAFENVCICYHLNFSSQLFSIEGERQRHIHNRFQSF